MEQRLLNLREFKQYLNIGETQARKMLKSKNSTFSVKLGNRWYADKRSLDKWIDENCQSQTTERIKKIG